MAIQNIVSSQIIIDRFLRNTISEQYKLNSTEKLIMVILASFMGNKDECFPSTKSLAIACGTSRRTVIKYIKSLENKSLIIVNRDFMSSNNYSFNLSEINQPVKETTKINIIRNEINYEKKGVSKQRMGYANHAQGGMQTVHRGYANRAQGVCKPCTLITSINNINEYKNNKSEVETSPRGKNESSEEACTQIFSHWKNVMNHPKAKLDPKRKRSIVKAMKLGFDICQLKEAINGCSRSPFHMGDNDRRQIYDDITLIFRDASHIEKFSNIQNSKIIRQEFMIGGI